MALGIPPQAVVRAREGDAEALAGGVEEMREHAEVTRRVEDDAGRLSALGGWHAEGGILLLLLLSLWLVAGGGHGCDIEKSA